jgi:hypothetical protein
MPNGLSWYQLSYGCFRSGPFQVAVLMAKYLLTKGGFFRLAYQMRKLPSLLRMTDWLVV